MLINCPECDLQVSDRAKMCPHCGFPIAQPTITRSETTKTQHRAKYMRLPNGFGQITKLKTQNLRNPYRAMVTVGKTPEGRPICKLLKPQAYFPTYKDAYEALLEYNRNPYDLDVCMTVKELYEKWLPEYSKKLKSQSSLRTITSAWAYCYPVYSMRCKDVRARHIKGCMNIENITPNMSFRVKSLFNLMFDYAVEYEIIDKNYARTFGLSDANISSKPVTEHRAFTEEELNILWKYKDDERIMWVLVQTYTGMRPQELTSILLSNVKIEENIIIGGMKTEAGINRIIPIHKNIIDLTKKLKDLAILRGCDHLLSDPDGEPLTYDKYNKRFHLAMQSAGILQHRPHDPRKTFITMAKRKGVDEFAIKRVVGHVITDITESIYTERDTNWLIDEINKI